MTTYATGNPLGSTAVKDLYDNAENVDNFVNGPDVGYVDRFNKFRKSWAGIEGDFQQFLMNSGYEFIGEYDDPGELTISARNQIFAKDGEFWRASATLALPYTTVNNWAIDQPKFVSVGDAVLRQDLADISDLTLGAALVGRAVRHFNTAAELLATPGRYDGDVAYLSGYFSSAPGVGSGLVRWRAGYAGSTDNGTRFPATGGAWERPILDDTVHLEWFGIVGDGVTLEDAKVRAAVAATPVGGTLVMPSREMTVLMDVPSLQGRWPAAANFNKEGMTVIGNHACIFKLKDFVSAYNDYTGVTAVGTFRVSRSNVRVHGLSVDANADHHYEIVAGGFKQWEELPSNRRPPSGFIVTVDDNAANVDSVKLIDCKVYRPLQGFYAAGNLSIVPGASLDDITFFQKTMPTNLVTNCEFDRCEVSYARGNDFINVSGTYDCRTTRCISRNSMYHSFRHYAGVESCLVDSCAAYTNYTEIASRWNETDLGYWRTNNPASADFKIQRSGYAIGATAAQTAANSGNVRRCVMSNNTMWYSANTDIGQSVIPGGIVDSTQHTLASFFIWQAVNGNQMLDNVSHNSPFIGVAYENSILSLNPATQGVVFRGGAVNNCAREGLFSIGTGPAFDSIAFTNCGIEGSGLGVWYVQGGATIINCPRRWERSTPNTLDLIKFVEYGTAGRAFISNNPVRGYTGAQINKLSTDIVHGTDGGGVSLTLLAGWATGSEPALITVDCAGNVTMTGRINTAAGGTDTFATLSGTLVMYRPREDTRFVLWQDSGSAGATIGMVTESVGDLSAVRGAVAAGTPVTIQANWKVDLRV